MTFCRIYCFTLGRPSAVSVTLASRVSLTSIGLLNCIELRREALLEAGEVEPRVAVVVERLPLVLEFKSVEWVESNVVIFMEGSMGVGGISVTLMGNDARDRVSGPKVELAKMEPERVVVGDIVNSGSCSYMSAGASGVSGAKESTTVATGGDECSCKWSMV